MREAEGSQKRAGALYSRTGHPLCCRGLGRLVEPECVSPLLRSDPAQEPGALRLFHVQRESAGDKYLLCFHGNTLVGLLRSTAPWINVRYLGNPLVSPSPTPPPHWPPQKDRLKNKHQIRATVGILARQRSQL